MDNDPLGGRKWDSRNRKGEYKCQNEDVLYWFHKEYLLVPPIIAMPAPKYTYADFP
jgi:hypothetical protein